MGVIKMASGHHLVGMSDEHQLVAAAMAGDSEAWERLAVAWLPTVHSWCVRLGGPRLDAQDLCQEVFVIAFTRLHTLRDPQAFPAWIFGITRREILRHGRRAWLRRWVPGVEPRERSAPGGPEQDAERAQLVAEVQAVLARLPIAQREVLVLCDVEERTSAEVAGLLAIPHGTVRSRLRLARARFRREASGRLPSAGPGSFAAGSAP
jgi:RNA polymerase sigma-70 factor, ECF subfamily